MRTGGQLHMLEAQLGRANDAAKALSGRVTLREAFARSLNSVAVQLSERVGREKVVQTAKRLGVARQSIIKVWLAERLEQSASNR